MANKEKDKKAKVAPERPSNQARWDNFMRTTGLSLPHSAKYRRFMAKSK